MTPGERSHQPRAMRCWKHGTAPVIGLTGGVASGKSSVASLFAEAGFAVIDADSVGHAVLDLPAVRGAARRSFRTRRGRPSRAFRLS